MLGLMLGLGLGLRLRLQRRVAPVIEWGLNIARLPTTYRISNSRSKVSRALGRLRCGLANQS